MAAAPSMLPSPGASVLRGCGHLGSSDPDSLPSRLSQSARLRRRNRDGSSSSARACSGKGRRPAVTAAGRGSRRGGAGNTAKVQMSDLGTFSSGAESVVLTATRKSDSGEVIAAESFPASQIKAAKRAASRVATSAEGMVSATPLKALTRTPLGVWGLALPAAALLGAVGLAVSRQCQGGERTVDDLARRGFISSDRSVPLEVIQDFEDPTAVRDYQFGGARLVELEPLAPLTQEKMDYHRELRRREHGWKKPEHVLVEGEAVPAGVDPAAVRFIPKKHPFALSSDEVDEAWSEDVARRRLRQRRGRPEKEQQRSRQQLERLRREMDTREAALRSGDRDNTQTRVENKSGVLPNMDD